MPSSLRKAQLKTRRKFPDRRRAQQYVEIAIRDGVLVPAPCCVCGTTECIEAHHKSYEYTKYLDVVWLCRRHHADLHKQLRAQGIEIPSSPLAPKGWSVEFLYPFGHPKALKKLVAAGVLPKIKRCAKCHVVKPNSSFNQRTSAPDGANTYCRLCQAEMRFIYDKRKRASEDRRNAQTL